MESQEDKVLRELQNSGEPRRRWYTSWWGILLILVAVAALILVSWFGNQLRYYVSAFENKDKRAFEGIFVDASGFGTGQYSRLEVETSDDPYYGPIDADVVVVEFGDFLCPYCKQNAPILRRIQREYGDRVKFIWRDFPLSYVHPEALMAAEAGECADDQGKFWELHDILYERQNEYKQPSDIVGYAAELGMDTAIFETCLTSNKYQAEVANDFQEGIRFEIKGTPTFFINGVKISGVIDYNTFRELLNRFLGEE